MIGTCAADINTLKLCIDKIEAPSKETQMGRNLDLENCKNKQEAVLAAYVEEFEENERRICDEGAWAISLDLSRIKVLVANIEEILPGPSTY
jgi:hypothetical protein